MSLLLVIAMIFSMTGAALAAEATDYTDKLVILHTNDSHSRVDTNLGFAAVAAAKSYYESLGANVLLLDAGDTLHGLPLANLSTGGNIVEIMNAVGYDAMAPGNHDFNYGTNRLLALADMMDFPLLSANYTTKAGKLVFDGSVVLEAGNAKVGVVGISTPETAYKTSPLNTAGYTFNGDSMAELVQAQIDALLAQDVDYIIALGHLGIDEESAPWRSTDIIAGVSGLDAFVDGHSHTALSEGMIVQDKDGNDVVLAQTGEYLKNIGMLTLDGETITAGFVDTEGLEPDADVTALIGSINTDLMPLLNEVVASTTVNLNGERAPGNRTEETNLGDLAADALRYVSGADVALTNGGGIRVSLPIDHTNPEDEAAYIAGTEPGQITYGDLNAVFPFGNVVVTIDITGADLLAALEHGTKSAPEAAGGFPQISGISFTLNTSRTENRVSDVLINGQPLDLTATYSLATNDFTQVGGDDYTMLAGYAKTGEYSALDEALIAYITEELGGVIGEEYAAPQGRITTQASPVYFDDVRPDDWFYSSVNYVYENGIMMGTDTGFAPNTTMTRGMMITILHRLAGTPETKAAASAYFDDVADGAWYADAVAWAYENGITYGVEDRLFAPMDTMTCEQLVTFLYRVADEQLGISIADSQEAYWETVREAIGSPALSDGATRAQAACVLEAFMTIEAVAERTGMVAVPTAA